jgi:hypothetical protein
MSAPIEPLLQSRLTLESQVADCMAALFTRHPHLIGFFLQDPVGSKDAINPSPIEGELCVLDIGFSIQVSDTWYEKVRERIRATVQQILSESPEAFTLLRERTFARAMH